MRRKKHLIFLLCLVLGLSAGRSWAAVTVEALVEKQEVYVGEPFVFQVAVQGHDAPTAPELGALKDFQVQERGGQQNNSESVTIINGHMQRESRRGYVFTYQLTAKRAGMLTIPALPLQAGAERALTKPLAILAKVPTESEDFKLRLQLEKEQAYVGEPVTVNVVWYIGREVKGFEFQLPLLTDPNFEVADVETPPVAAGHQDEFLRIPFGQGETVAEKGRGRLDGREFLTVSFKKVLIPRVAGVLTLPPATVACQAVAPGRRSQHDPFADLFGNDPFLRRNAYETAITPSNTPKLTVRPLPSEGKPAGFTGLVGNYRLVASATPTEVQVGDPITLTVQVSGPHLKRVELPPLGEQLPAADFKVPAEMAPGELGELLKTFTQTIRVARAGVPEIPKLTLSFFNSDSGRYESAVSEPIPLRVKEAKQLTVRDAEGVAAPPAKRSLNPVEAGIAYNYEDEELLAREELPAPWRLSGGRILFLAGLPGLFFSLLGVKLFRRWRQSARVEPAKMAYSEFRKSLHGAAGVAAALQIYLGRRLGLAPGAITSQEVASRWAGLVEEPLLARLAAVMAQGEAARYAGGVGQGATPALLAEAEAVVAALEARLTR